MSEISSAARKSRRAACWTRGEKRKAGRRLAQAARETANRSTRDASRITPWERAKFARKVRRDNDPRVMERRVYWRRARGPSAA